MSMVRVKLSDVHLDDQDLKELEALARKPDSEIDYSDIPPLKPEEWKDAVRGKFYRPVKQPVTMRLDADVLGWLRSKGAGYQTRANQILREAMLAEIKRHPA